MVQQKNVFEDAGEQVRRRLRGCLLVSFLLAVAAVSSPVAQAQSTSGSIVGDALAGDIVVVKSSAGDKRKATVKNNGHYTIRALPLGVYTVVLMKDGEEYDTHYNVRLRPGGSARVDFPCKNDHCAKG